MAGNHTLKIASANNAMDTPARIIQPGCMEIRRLLHCAGPQFLRAPRSTARRKSDVEMAELKCVADAGCEATAFFDFKENYKGQITFLPGKPTKRFVSLWAFETKYRPRFRRNVITVGTDLNELIGRDFQIQGVRFHGTEECRPCYWMDQAFAPGANEFLKGQAGWRAVILSDGVLWAGAG